MELVDTKTHLFALSVHSSLHCENYTFDEVYIVTLTSIKLKVKGVFGSL